VVSRIIPDTPNTTTSFCKNKVTLFATNTIQLYIINPNDQQLMDHSLHFLAGTASSELATSIAILAKSPLIKWKLQTFSDGELRPMVEEDVKGCEVIIIQSTYPPVTHIMELLLLIDATRQAGANKVSVVVPYMGYLRQDKVIQPGEAHGAALLVKLLHTAGADKLMICDPHTKHLAPFFQGTLQYVPSYPVFMPYIEQLALDKLCFVAPDEGAIPMTQYYAHYYQASLVTCHKIRYRPNEIAVLEVQGNVQGLDVMIVDDIIDTGVTLCTVAAMLHQQGARSIRAICTHALLSGPAYDSLINAPLGTLVVTNTIPIKKPHPKIQVLDIAPVLWKAMSDSFLTLLYN
jgi:ribose-phosphate pyrophosphokinase